MRYLKIMRGVSLAASVIVAGCATAPPPPPPAPVAVRPPAPPAAPVARIAPQNMSPAQTLEGYRTDVARRIAAKNPDSVADSLPPILKSVVVMEISIDREGNPTQIVVRRSNGFKDLEQTAIASVRRAGPLPAPSPAVIGGASVVSYYETWLFRGDGRFQIRSVAETRKVSATSGSLANKN